MKPLPAIEQSSVYLPALDGIRFIAFLSVFMLHSHPNVAIPIISTFTQFGWGGVDQFFVLSSFLFFHLFKAEFAARGRIAIRAFYLRRVLRIYPLMLSYPLFMLVCGLLLPTVFNVVPTEAFVRLTGISLGLDNLLVWVAGWNYAVPLSSHLWTLSFEFQIYLIIPFLFLGFISLERKQFLLLLGAIWAWSLAARAAFIFLRVPYSIIFVTPFLRPESVLLGVTVSVFLDRKIPTPLVAVVGLASLVVFINMPSIAIVNWYTLLLYPVVGILCASFVWMGLTVRWLSNLLGSSILRFLGKISFGLYVYHGVALAIASRVSKAIGFYTKYPYGEYFYRLTFAFLLVVIVSMLSYYILEAPFLRLKERKSFIKSRPV